MKKILMLLSLVISAQSFAIDTDVSKKALNKLMNKNPVAYTPEGQPERVNTLIAHMMTSSFNENGTGALSVVENNCVKENSIITCELNVYSSDRKIDQNGSFVQTEDSTESSLKIKYKMREGFFFLVGKVEYFFAG